LQFTSILEMAIPALRLLSENPSLAPSTLAL
jgi:hypothetical protein